MATLVYNDTFPHYLMDHELTNSFKSADRFLRMLEEEGDTRDWYYAHMLKLYNTLASEVTRRKLDLEDSA
jgi:hypothetical protein